MEPESQFSETRIDNIELAWEMAHAMVPDMNRYVELTGLGRKLGHLASEYTEIVGSPLIYRSDDSFAMGTTRDPIQYVNILASNRLQSANSTAEEVRQTFELEAELASILSDEDSMEIDEIDRFSGLSTKFSEEESVEAKLATIECARENKAVITEVLELTGSPKSLNDLTEDEIRQLILLTQE
jgi:hypothetical protein